MGPPPLGTPAGRRRPDVGRLISASILVGLGSVVAQSVLTGSYTAYVRPVMQMPLALTAVVLLVAGVAGYLSGIRPEPVAETGADGHPHRHHGRIPRSALLALVPLAVLALLRPPALDDAATESVAPAASQSQAGTDEIQIEPLPGDPDTPRAMTFNELSIRATSRGGPETLRGRMLSLEGFVAKKQTGAPAGTVRVGRYKIWCCAADATFGAAYIRWPAGAAVPAPGAWFRVVGRVQDFRSTDYFVMPVLDAQQVQPRPAPKHQYEY